MAKALNRNLHSKPALGISGGGTMVALLVILLIAATLRFVQLDQVPPAIHADEAPNAWNAYTLLKTGKDQYGVSWPIFYTRAFGDYRTTSYVYALIPFQFIAGMNVWTTRLPAAIGGVVTVLLIYLIGARWFGAETGLVAAAMLALNPWHLQVTRWGHEASLVPLLVMLSVASLLWAKLPVDDEQSPPRLLMAGLAGALIGISCYGYSAVRLFLPCFFVGIIIVSWRAWCQLLSNRDGRLAVMAFFGGAVIFLGPLLWVHLSDPSISERARILGWIWDASDSAMVRAGKIIARHLDHYSLGFLFILGDQDPALSPPNGFGLFHWYDLPLMVAGIIALLKIFKVSIAARVLLLWLVLYPVGDILFPHVSSHSLRSLPGVGALVLLGSVGALQIGKWYRNQPQSSFKSALLIFAIVVVLFSQIAFVRSYFGYEFSRNKSSLIVFGADILEAAKWIQPRLAEPVAVFITGQATHPDIVSLVGLNYDPQQWFREPRDFVLGPLPDGRFKDAYIYLRYGKIYFMYTDSSIAAINKLAQNGKPDRVFFVVRPGELGLERYAPPIHEIRGANGAPRLWIFALNI